jgi:hypothetical protein
VLAVAALLSCLHATPPIAGLVAKWACIQGRCGLHHDAPPKQKIQAHRPVKSKVMAVVLWLATPQLKSKVMAVVLWLATPQLQ